MRSDRFRVLGPLLFALAATASAQSWEGPAALGVEVNDQRGRDLSGARVEITYRDGDGGPGALLTDGKGRAAFVGLAPGAWSVEVSHPGHLSYVAAILLQTGKKAEITASFLQATGTGRDPLRVKLFKARSPAGSPAPPPAEAPAAAPAPPADPTPAPPAQPGPEPEPQPTPSDAARPETESAATPAVPPAAPPAPPEEVPEPSSEPEPEPSPAVPSESAVETAPAPTPEPDAPVEPASQPEPATRPEVAPPPVEPAAPPARPATEPEAEPQPQPVAAEPEAPPAPPTAPAPEPQLSPEAPPTEEPEPPAPVVESDPEPQPQPPSPAPAEVEMVPEPTPAAQPPPVIPPESLEPMPPAPAPTTPPAAAPAPAPPSPAPPLRSFSQRSCAECKPGEWAATAQLVLPPGPGCPAGVDLDARPALVQLASAGASGLDRFAGQAAGPIQPSAVGLLPGAEGAELEAIWAGLGAESCRVAAVALPAGAQFVGFRFEAGERAGRGDSADCLAGEECPAGSAYWSFNPKIVRGSDLTVVWSVFENRSAGAPKTGRLVVYFVPPSSSWRPAP